MSHSILYSTAHFLFAVRMRIELISPDRQSGMLAITPTNHFGKGAPVASHRDDLNLLFAPSLLPHPELSRVYCIAVPQFFFYPGFFIFPQYADDESYQHCRHYHFHLNLLFKPDK